MSFNIQTPRTCEHCGTAFTAKTFFTRYCSKQCNNAHYKVLHRKHREPADPPPKRSVRTTGEVPENVDQEYYEVHQACVLMHISRRTLYRLFTLRKLKKKTIMSRTVVLKEDIKTFFAYQ